MSMHHYANKETRDRLRDKSILCYGRAGVWKKRMIRKGISVVEIEDVMDNMITILKGVNSVGNEVRSEQTEHESITNKSNAGSIESP